MIGGCALDITARSYEKMIAKTSNPGEITLSYGGVARNVLEVLCKLNSVPFFITCIGNDEFGDILETHLRELDVYPLGVLRSRRKTALYDCMLNSDGDMESAVADMKIFDEISPIVIAKFEKQIQNAPIVFIDANIRLDTAIAVATLCEKHAVPLFYDPTSVPKSLLFLHDDFLKRVTYIKPNRDEIIAMASKLKGRQIDSIDECLDTILKKGVKNILLTLGEKGVIVANRSGNTHFKPLTVRVVNTTGAGDNFCGGFMYGVVHGKSIETCVRYGQNASKMAIETELSVNPELSETKIKSL
jgi:pseudouridine kinase